MAYQHTQSHHGAEIAQTIWDGTKAVFTFVATFFFSIAEANRRMHQVEVLQSKSDKELAALGLRREDIARHVFFDTLYM